MKYSDITERIIGCAMRIHAELDLGLKNAFIIGDRISFNFDCRSLQFKKLHNKKFKPPFQNS